MLTLGALRAVLPDSIEVVRHIHEGGQRHVFEVRVRTDHCVLKLMPEMARSRAEREVAIGSKFDHPNLPTILDADLGEVEIDGERFVYFLERFVEGTTLAERQAPMSPCDALDLADALVAAVAYLWDRHHIVHRDIKPLNIMQRPDGTYVLLDIGVARHQDLTTLTVIPGEHQPGTIGYLAPEQLAPLKGREIDYRADLFVIGIVVYQQVTGHLPFDPTSASYRTLLSNGLAPELDGVPPGLSAFVSRLLAPRPHGRLRIDKVPDHIERAKEELGCS